MVKKLKKKTSQKKSIKKPAKFKKSKSKPKQKRKPKPKVKAKVKANIKTPKRQTKTASKTPNLLEDRKLYEFLTDLVGEDGIKVVKKITEKEVSDVDLADKMDLKANIIRKHLYRLYEAGVVTYRRHRSKTGWYTYYWKLHPDRVQLAISTEEDMEVKELQKLMDYEKENHFFQCKNKCTRAAFDEAMEHKFKCPKCANALEFLDNTDRIVELENKIGKLSGKGE